MVKIITCRRTTTTSTSSRLPPSPFNSVSSPPSSSFLFLFPLLPPPPSLSIVPFYLSFFTLLFLYLPLSKPPCSSSEVFLSSGSSPTLPGLVARTSWSGEYSH